MDRLRRTLSFRTNQKKEDAPTAKSTKTDNKPLQWQDDEKAVRFSTCSFNVKYLGSIEVQESRGMHVCEQAIQALLNQKNQHTKAVLLISDNALRVVDETNKGLIVDQTIEKVSFCAPDRHHEKGFAYICRDGTTRRWLCHGFLSTKEVGERLSHAVGYAFQICLERKQKRDRECNVTVEDTQYEKAYTCFASFRSTSITNRQVDPQSVMVAASIPSSNSLQRLSETTGSAIERPRPKGNHSATLMRSMSMRSDDFNPIANSLFKRQSSLKPSDLPSIQESKHRDLAISEEIEPVSTTNEFSKLSLFDSTNTTSHNHTPTPLGKSSLFSLPSNTDNENILSKYRLPSSQTQHINPNGTSINEAVHSNLNALVQSNHPSNPFSPYGFSIAAQSQSSDKSSRQSSIFSPKRGSNPFDDDLIRR